VIRSPKLTLLVGAVFLVCVAFDTAVAIHNWKPWGVLSPYRLIGTIIMFFLAAVFFVAVFNGWRRDEGLRQWFPELFIACWVIIIPLFYLLGYYVFLVWPPACPGTTEYNEVFEKLKYGQEVGRNFWIAVSAVMAAYLYGGKWFEELLDTE
jgi:hypothetical protein